MTSQAEDVKNGGSRWNIAPAVEEKHMDDRAPLSKDDEAIVALVHRRLIQDMIWGPLRSWDRSVVAKLWKPACEASSLR